AYVGNVWLGVLAGMISGIGIGLFLGYFHIMMDTDIWLTGIAINQIAAGGTVFAMFTITGDKGSTSALHSLTVPNIEIPLIKEIPFIGEVLSGQSFFTYVAIFMLIFIYILLYKTPLGLRIRAVGEYPMAAESVGENADRIKLIALAISGMCASFGGMFMSMSYSSRFVRDMVAGRGFIGIAAESMGGGMPFGAALSAFFFGIADSLSNVLQSFKVPAELVLIIPYLATIVGLSVYSARKQGQEKRKIEKNRLKEEAV
ncbi:MAG: ABC transporter permease, partial [Hungatella sp.]